MKEVVAYLSPHFDYDIFMSYSHGGKPGVGNAPLKRWSQAFIDHLTLDITDTRSMEFGALRIFNDRELDRTTALTEQLKRIVERSALLLIVMSPRYLGSAWCTDEREWFAGQFGDRRKGPGRVFVVRSVSTLHEQWPDFLKDSRGHADLGFQFHADTAQEGETPYGWPDLMDKSTAFYEALAPLRTTIIARLIELKAAQAAPSVVPTAAPMAAGARPRLYLHAPPIANNLRPGVTGALRQAGCLVVDPAPDAASAGIGDLLAESQARIRLAQRCDGLTLLRAANDRDFDNALFDIAFDELERINANRPRPLACAVLDQAGGYQLDPVMASKGVRQFQLTDPAWPAAVAGWVDSARRTAA